MWVQVPSSAFNPGKFKVYQGFFLYKNLYPFLFNSQDCFEVFWTSDEHKEVFHRFLDDETFLISDATLATVNGFILELRSDKHVCNDMAINTYLRGLRAFLYYCMEMDYMADFKIRIPKVDKKLKETYTDTELNVLLKKPNLKTCGFSEYKIWVFCA